MITEAATDLPIPAWVAKTLANVFRILHIDAFAVFSDANMLTSAQLSDLETGVISYFPNFVAARDLYQFDWSTC